MFEDFDEDFCRCPRCDGWGHPKHQVFTAFPGGLDCYGFWPVEASE